MIQNPHSAESWLMVELVVKSRLIGLDIVQNPHSIGFWLLMEVVRDSAIVPHTDTQTNTHIEQVSPASEEKSMAPNA